MQNEEKRGLRTEEKRVRSTPQGGIVKNEELGVK
jgi:hypothetical protein